MWWPCKDHMYDEPDSMLISVTVPAPIAADRATEAISVVVLIVLAP